MVVERKQKQSTLKLGIAVVMLIALALAQGCKREQSPRHQKPLHVVAVIRAEESVFIRQVEVTGSVTPVKAVTLRSPAEGPVLSAMVREGDRVRAGDTLVVLGRREAVESSIASLREEMHREEQNLKRVEELVQSHALPGEQLDLARTSFERARAQLAKALESNQDYQINAPWDGVVSRIYAHEGDYLAPRVPVLELFDPATLVVRVSVPEQDAVHLQRFQEASIRLDAYPERVFSATASRLYPNLDERMRTRTVEFTIQNPPLLLPGMFARVQIQAEAIPNTILIPSQSVTVSPGGEAFVFKYQSGVVRKTIIELGVEDRQLIQVLSGIQAGDSIVVAGQAKLKNNAEVRLRGAGKSQSSDHSVSKGDASETGTTGR